jgi:hypothetical protein
MDIIKDKLNLQNLALLCDDTTREECLKELDPIVIKRMAIQVLEYMDLKRDLNKWCMVSDGWRSTTDLNNILTKHNIL